MKSIVCWLWNDGSQRARSFEPNHVNVLANMVARHLDEPHRFICITNLPSGGFSPKVEVLPMPKAAAALLALRTPERPHFPSCYPRLWMFSEEAKCLGDRVLLVDIDLVVVANLAPIFDMPQDFVGWRPYRDWGKQERFGGGIYLLTPGTRTRVWTDFHGAPSIAQARAAGFRGSDQAWLSFKLGLSETYWSRSSGIYSIRDMKGTEAVLPKDARLVQMNGPAHKPWNSGLPWVREHWR
jgi:hypothetical protein